MRDHGNDREQGDPRRVPSRSASKDDTGDVVAARAASAAVGGQRSAIAPSGALGLQRAVGNAGVASVLSSPSPSPSSDEATIQREHAGAEAEAPLYESHGEGEEEI